MLGYERCSKPRRCRFAKFEQSASTTDSSQDFRSKSFASCVAKKLRVLYECLSAIVSSDGKGSVLKSFTIEWNPVNRFL